MFSLSAIAWIWKLAFWGRMFGYLTPFIPARAIPVLGWLGGLLKFVPATVWLCLVIALVAYFTGRSHMDSRWKDRQAAIIAENKRLTIELTKSARDLDNANAMAEVRESEIIKRLDREPSRNVFPDKWMQTLRAIR